MPPRVARVSEHRDGIRLAEPDERYSPTIGLGVKTMRRIVACSVLILALAGGLRIPGLPWWGLAAGLLIVAAAAWRLSLCPHDGPLALLPATTDLEGAPLPPRWYCDACGRTWAAHFEKEHTPVRKF